MRRRSSYVARAWAAVLLAISAPTLASAAGAGVRATPVNRVERAASATVMGGAWKSENAPIPNAKVQLRNLVTGKVHSTTVTNEAGQFVFNDIEAGSYIVELVSNRGKIVAISHTLAVGPGETVATFVRTGTKVPWFDGFFGNAASTVAMAAASMGVTAVSPDEMRPVSPQK